MASASMVISTVSLTTVPIDCGPGDEAGACPGPFVDAVFPPGRLPLPEVVNLQRNRPCHSANHKITGHLVIYLAYDDYLTAAETDLGKILYVEKVRAAQVRVTRRLAAPDLARIDDDFDRRAARAFRIEGERAVYVFKMSTDVSDHHVPGAKFGGGMSRFKSPFRHR